MYPAVSDLMRSIPAHAGEPAGMRISGVDCGVYPRPRGGTVAHVRATMDDPGLSPPTRGNLLGIFISGHSMRSIPAHAGEPVIDGDR